MVYKVLLTGTFETGKSTLLNLFARYASVAVVTEVARDLLESNPKLELDSEFQDILFREQLHREAEALKTDKSIILCDRGILDIIAYSEVLGHPLKEEWLASMDNRYNLVLIFDMKDTPVLSQTYEELEIDVTSYRLNIDKKIREIVKRYKLESLILSGNLEERKNRLIEYLKQKQQWE